jgi:hypothetical protein
MRACRQADTACPTVAGGACSGVGGAGRCAKHGCSTSAQATGTLLTLAARKSQQCSTVAFEKALYTWRPHLACVAICHAGPHLVHP